MSENIRILDGLFRQSLPTTEVTCRINLAHTLSVSRSLRGWPRKPGVRYLREDRDSLCILGAVLSLIHPVAAKRGLAIMDGIAKGNIKNEATNSLDEARLVWSSERSFVPHTPDSS